MQAYFYTGFAALRPLLSRLGGVFFMAVTIGIGSLAISVYLQTPTATGVLCFGLTYLFGGMLGSLFFILAYPDVSVDDQGITISIWLYHIRIPWSNVIGLDEKGFPRHNIILVRAKRITPIHFLYGLYYSQKLEPGFFIAKSIRNYDELKKTITTRALLS
jgi:hypothetical protein